MRMMADTLALRFTSRTACELVRQHSLEELLKRKPGLPDAPGDFQFADDTKTYVYITEQFVTMDFSRIDLLRFAAIAQTYQSEIIMRAGGDCKANSHFSISYLAAVLSKEGSELIEEMRREMRLEKLVQDSPRPELPALRPTGMIEQMERLAEERRIDDVLKGR